MSLKIYNLNSGKIEEEKVCAEKSMRFLYGSCAGKIALWLIVARGFFSKICGAWADSKISRRAIEKFVKNNSIDLSDSEKGIESFRTFNEFFTRALKFNARPVGEPDNQQAISLPADGRHLLIRNLNAQQTFYAKSQKFNLEKFLADKELACRFEGGDMLISRLSPMDYHRFHYPVCGEIVARRIIKGKLYSVSPIALAGRLSIMWENRRVLNVIENEEMGMVAFVEIGATNVGSIVNFGKVGDNVMRGAEGGLFRFGGSCLISIFEKKAEIEWNAKLKEYSGKGIESYGKVGEIVGESRRK